MPDLLQSVFGDKALVGFARYGRTLGALPPSEALLILAGRPDRVDEDVRRRIERSAVALIGEGDGP